MIAWLLWFLVLPIPEVHLPTGEIVDSVSCLEKPDEKYALYLPSSYDPERKWPILILLDPAARGRTPLEHFAAAAEARNYVLIGSHNSKNGPLQPTIDTLSALWSEVSARYSIDPARVYLGGFSGGARMASHLAQSANVAGVIAVGAGLLQSDAQRFPFAYAAVAGSRDMNYLEVRILAENLVHRGTRAAFFQFDGGHQWPPDPTTKLILEWMDVEAMRSGLMAVDSEFLDSYQAAAMERAHALEAEGRHFDAFLAYQELVRVLEGLGASGQAKQRRDLLERDPRVVEQEKRRSRTDKIERTEIRELLKQFLSEKPSKNDDWWKKKLASFQELAGRNVANPQDLSERLSQFVLSYASEKAWFASEAGNHDLALYFLGVALLARPEAPELHYRKARTNALLGDSGSAIADLRRAVELGWQDGSRLAADEAFDALRTHPQFPKINARF